MFYPVYLKSKDGSNLIRGAIHDKRDGGKLVPDEKRRVFFNPISTLLVVHEMGMITVHTSASSYANGSFEITCFPYPVGPIDDSEVLSLFHAPKKRRAHGQNNKSC